ncbi:MAG TPA: PspC domain-containing protein [Acidimicrobiales bacterium]|nr:PspC domain-containing protein [Acidimicrobiales bacterium]
MARGAGTWDHRRIPDADTTARYGSEQAAQAGSERAAAPRVPPPEGWWCADGAGGGRYGPPWSRPEWRRSRHQHIWRRLQSLKAGDGPFRRSHEERVLAGVCGGISRATGIDVTLVRIAFVVFGIFSGILALAYAAAWLIVPMDNESTNIMSRALHDRRGIRLLVACVPAVIGLQIVVSVLHIGYVGLIGWPVFLAGSVVILIWRNASEHERGFLNEDVAPMLGGLGGGSRWVLFVRIALGLLLTLGGALVLVLGHTTAAALRPVGGALLIVAAIVVVLGPWWLSLARDLMAERQARALAEERAQMAAHVHDSVLQTLALIQRAADDPQHVMRLARAQERELRGWLFEGRPPGAISEDAQTLSEGLGLLQRHVEAEHGITVQVVTVGDCPLDDALRALLDAAKEATVNAAKWSGAPEVSLYAEVEPGTVMLFVRDRGRGFDLTSVPSDRQGIAQSIKGRVTRFGGRVDIRSAPGEGAEVEMSMPRRQLVP